MIADPSGHFSPLCSHQAKTTKLLIASDADNTKAPINIMMAAMLGRKNAAGKREAVVSVACVFVRE